MKKMNNKGFAITTLLYGLMSVGFLVMTILMGIMSQNRQNTATLVKKIEEELNRYGETETTFAYTGSTQEYVVPYGQAGWYKIELWGAKTNGVLGDYTSGVVYLNDNEKLYFYLGNTCANATACGTAFNKGNTEVRTNTATESATIMRASGYGKTSYIVGYAGSNVPTEAGANSNQTNHYSGKYFINGLTVKKVHDGQGMANVELVSKGTSTQYPAMKSSKLSGVRYIKHCNDKGSTLNLLEIQAIDITTGKNLIKDLSTSYISGLGGTVGNAKDGVINSSYATIANGGCVQIDLRATYNLSEIAIWHNYGTNTSHAKNKLEVSSNGSTWKTIKNYSSSTTSVYSSEIGEHYSAWQPDSTEALPSGRYYIFSIKEPNQVFTADNARSLTPPNKANVKLSLFKGVKLQKWTFERVAATETNLENKGDLGATPIYRVYESENNHALQHAEATGEKDENINAAKTCGNFWWDLWQIIPLSNGTYKIKSMNKDVNRYIYTQSSGNVSSTEDITSSTDFSNRFRIVNAEY